MRNTNIEIGNINVGAIVQSWRKTSSANNLGWSPKVSVVGLLTSLNAHIINAIVGKKYGIK